MKAWDMVCFTNATTYSCTEARMSEIALTTTHVENDSHEYHVLGI